MFVENLWLGKIWLKYREYKIIDFFKFDETTIPINQLQKLSLDSPASSKPSSIL